MMHDIERERVRQHVKLIPYPSKPLASQTRQSQQIDPLHLVAPIVDEPLVEQQHVLRELHHHVPSIHPRPVLPTAPAGRSRSTSSARSFQAVGTSCC